MSMALALVGVRDYLRGLAGMPWSGLPDAAAIAKHIGINDGNVPPPTAPPYYLSLDEASVATAGERNFYAGEDLAIEVAVWHELGAKPFDLSGQLKFRTDPYLAAMVTVEQLERAVYSAIHQTYALRTAINSQFGLPSSSLGDVFLSALSYQGRGRSEKVTTPDGDGRVFFGRRMLYRGLKRTQYAGSQK